MPSSSATTCIAKSEIDACFVWSSCSTGISALRVAPVAPDQRADLVLQSLLLPC